MSHRTHHLKRSYGQTSSPAAASQAGAAATYKSGPQPSPAPGPTSTTPQPSQAPPPLPPGPPPQPPSASGPQQPNPYANYGYPAAYAAAQHGAHPQYPAYGYGGVAAQVPTSTASSYVNYAQPQAAYAAYPGCMVPPPPPPPGYPTPPTYYPQPGQQHSQQPQGGQPPYGAPAYGYPAPNGAAPYSGAPGAYPPPPPGNGYPIPSPQHGLPSPQGAPPYKRTRYEGGPAPPLPPGPAPPPPALPPVGGSSSRGGPPPPRGAYDRGPPPPSSQRGPPPPSRYDDRYDGPPPLPGPYRDDYRDRLPPPPPGHYDRGDRYGPPPPSRYDDRRPPPPSLRRDERLPPPPGPAHRDQGSPGPRGGAPRGPAFAPRDGPSSRPPRGALGRSGGGGGGGGGSGRPVSALPGGGRSGFVSSSAKRGDRFAAVDAPRGPRNARVNAIPPHGQKKERKWGARTTGTGPGGSGKEKSGDGRTLTDFRIAGLEITELEWTWAAKAQAVVKALVEADANSTEKENGDGSKGSGAGDATPPTKKKTKSQRKAERRRAAKAAAAAIEEPTSNAAEDASAQEEDDDEVDGEPVATSSSPSQSNTKQSKHLRDEDEDSESRGGTDVDATVPKKVKADTGEVVKLESVDAKPEVEAESAQSSPAAQEDVDGEPVEANEAEDKDAVADASPAEKPIAPTPAAPSNPPFKLSAANSAPPANAPNAPAAERPPSDRENSRLRIYFSSPVDSVSTYINSGGNGSVRGATVEPQAPARDTSMAPPTIEEEAPQIKAEAEEAAKPEVVSSEVEATGEAAANEESEVDGEPVDSVPLEGGALESAVETTDPTTEAQPSIETDATAVANQDDAAEAEADASFLGDVSMSSSYPPDPYAQGQPSITESTSGEETEDKQRESSAAPGNRDPPPHLTPPEPSADRISISYARNTRRMVLDAEVVESVKIFRAEGRIELSVLLRPADMGDGEDAVPDEFRVCQGILYDFHEQIEALDREHDDYLVIDRLSLEAAWRTRAANDDAKGATEVAKEKETEDLDLDPLLPPLHHLLAASMSDETGATALSVAPGFTRDRITVIAHFDRSNPLTEARWVKTGEIDQWITGLALEKKDDKLSAWKGKIIVHDPEPPPTIQDALDAWASSSSVGSLADRKVFVAGHMSDIDNVLEILLRLARGDTRSHYNTNHSSSSGPSVPVLAASLSAPYPDSQTQVSLAVLAMFRLSVQTAEKAGLDTQEVHRQVSEIVKGVPHHMQFKALDGMFLEHRKKNKAAAPTPAVPSKAKDVEVSAPPVVSSTPAPAPTPMAGPAKEAPVVATETPVVAKE
ncbi:BQ2448_4840 [Microbotryum intermedium]|uniref:BQ2448_4840 protein n=1 Tax=Microbotryum intermedium TaxID=269621 RepID=A0A238FM40_9BASI|nr:BQ2448_4840 [Microbotryum intermedium]